MNPDTPAATSPENAAALQANGESSMLAAKLYDDSYNAPLVGLRRQAQSSPGLKHVDFSSPYSNQVTESVADKTRPVGAANTTDSDTQFPQLADLGQRLARAGHGGIGMAWTKADGDTGDETANMAKHGLAFVDVHTLHMQWKDDQSAQLEGVATNGQATPDIDRALAMRKELLQKNPNMVILAEVREYDANPNSTPAHQAIPADSPWWQHNAKGQQIANSSYPQFDLLDPANPQFQDHVAAQAKALLQSGAVDGVMMDWWKNDQAHLDLLKKVRAAVGPDAVIIVNTNENEMSKEMTELVNGSYMESWQTKNLPDSDSLKKVSDPQDLAAKTKAIDKYWQALQDNLDYQAKYAASPQVPFLETWWQQGSATQRQELDRMRATTTLAMTHSDGYSLFADPDNNGKTPDHSHEWYSFYDAIAPLGKPAGLGTVRSDGSTTREFENGTVVCNATQDVPTTITFNEPRIKASSMPDSDAGKGEIIPAGTPVSIAPHDGDIFLKVKP